MPTTRSASNAKKPSSSIVDATLGEPGEEPSSTLSDVGEQHDDLQVCKIVVLDFRDVRWLFQSHLSALQRGIHNLKKNQEDLRRKNRRLKQEIDHLHNEADVSIQPVKSEKRGNPLLHVKVKELELEVRRLKKVTRFTSTTGCVLTLLAIRLVLWTARR